MTIGALPYQFFELNDRYREEPGACLPKAALHHIKMHAMKPSG
jgi:hypothetical protein